MDIPTLRWQAFLVRNCIIHHGARVNRMLGRIDTFGMGEKIILTQKMMERYFIAIEKMGGALFEVAPNTL